MCLTSQAAEPTTPGVWWRDDAGWKLYDASQRAAIEKGIAVGASRVDLANVVSLKYAGGARYVVDLCTMKQINLASGYTRDIKVVKAPATLVTGTLAAPSADDNASVKEELRACKKSIRSLKKMVLKLESDLMAVRLEVLEDRAKRVAAEVATAKQADNLRRASRGVSKEAVCERCDAGKYSELEFLSEDEN